MKYIFCAGNKTDIIVEKLKSRINNIELEPCFYIEELENIINTQQFDGIIIFQTSIQNNIPQFIYNYSFKTYFILENTVLIQELKENVKENNSIYLLQCLMKQITFSYIEQLLTKDVNYIKIEPEKKIDIELPKELDIENIDYVRNNIKEEKSVDYHQLVSNIEQNKQTSQEDLKVENQEKDNQKITHIKSIEEQIKELSTLNPGLIILATGTPRSYISTIAYNISSYLAKNNIEVALIDLDVKNCSQMILNNKIYNEQCISNQNNLIKALKTKNYLENNIVIEPNLTYLNNHILRDSLTFTEDVVENLHNLLETYKQIYKVIIIDCPYYNLDDQNLLPLLFNISDRIMFNIFYSNKDFITLMRFVEFLSKEQRENFFKKTHILSIDNQDKCLLNTDKINLEAIDELLKQNNIINQLKYKDLPVIGNLESLKEKIDLLSDAYIFNDDIIENYIVHLFGGN